MKVQQLIEAYQDARLRSQKRGPSTFRSLAVLLEPVFDADANDLTPAALDQLLGLMADKAPVHAARALGYAGPLFRWAATKGFLAADPLIGRGRPRPGPPRDRLLTVKEVRTIWSAAAQLDYPFGPAIQLLVLVPTTREEVGALRISDLRSSEDGGWIWRPRGNANEKFPWSARLPAPAAEVIQEAMLWRARGSDLLFSTNGATPISGWSKAKRRLDGQVEQQSSHPIEHWRLNDLRASFGHIVQQGCSCDHMVVERCLGRISAFTDPLSREWASSDAMQRQVDTALAGWATLVVQGDL